VPLALAALLAGACGGSSGSGEPVVTDSAGVAIVTNAAPAPGRIDGWRVEPEPLLDVGSDESGPAGVFERVAGLILLPDGGLVAGDEGAGEIRAFGPDGALRWRTGRSGDGPGEFRLLASLGAGPADSIWVFDFGNRRFTLLDTSGALARTFDIGVSISAPSAVGRLADGRFVLREMWGLPRGKGPQVTGMERDPAAIVALAADGTRLDTIAMYPGREVYVTVENGRGVMSTPLFARNTSVAVGDDRVLIGDQAAFAIDVLGADGAKRRSVRMSGLDLAIDGDVIRRTTDALLEHLPAAEREDRRRLLESLPGPPTMPAFGRILVAPSGDIWVSQHAPASLDPAAWTVFDADGRLLAVVAMPNRFQLEAVRGDRIAGVWRDEYDVEHVRVHTLSR
jgi:hypothetical protein